MYRFCHCGTSNGMLGDAVAPIINDYLFEPLALGIGRRNMIKAQFNLCSEVVAFVYCGWEGIHNLRASVFVFKHNIHLIYLYGAVAAKSLLHRRRPERAESFDLL